MAEKTKAKSKARKVTSTPKTGVAKSTRTRAEEDRQAIRLLTISFTLLSVAFTAMAFWKYPLN